MAVLLVTLVLSSILFTVVVFPRPSSSLSEDGTALLRIKEGFNFTGGDDQLSDWNSSHDSPCSWTGVGCHPNSFRVRSLSLAFRGIHGFISQSVGRLGRLQRLSLHHNNLQGSIPKDIGKCKELRAIYLNSNFLEGDIPLEIGDLSHLTILDLSNNMMWGIIPASLGYLNHLLFLNLSANSLVGEIPSTGRLLDFGITSFVGNKHLCGKQMVNPCQESLGFPVVLPPRYNDGTGHHTRYMTVVVMAAAVTSGVLVVVLLVCLSVYLVSRRKRSPSKSVKTHVHKDKGGKLVTFHGDLVGPTGALAEKLESLGDEHPVGCGGFGTVFCLPTDDGVTFAVKRMDGFYSRFDDKFERELEALGRVNHPNLSNLRAYFDLPPSKYLISEFMSLGSLDDILHGSERGVALSWNERLRIALGSARGLAHLHHDCRPTVVHGAIKSSNVLLNDKFEPRVSDFGLAKLAASQDAHITTVVAGSFGYMAPEYLDSGLATEKSDVYSFGVLLFELVTGKRPTDPCFVSKGLNIVGWMNTVWGERRVEDVVDGRCSNPENVGRVIETAMRCTAADPADRPSMLGVLRVLEQEALSPCSTLRSHAP